MTRRYDDPVDVRRRDDVPAEFLWRGRLYVVRDVLAHWIETGAWWRAAAARAAYVGTATDGGGSDLASDAAPTDHAAHIDGVGPTDRAAHIDGVAPTDRAALIDGAASLRDNAAASLRDNAAASLRDNGAGDREMWRVEASAGRARGNGVFDLCFDWTAGAWTLARALD
jgi:hypothetical protein